MKSLSLLLYKAWCESRTRFLIGAFVMVGLCLAVVLFQDALRTEMRLSGRPASYAGYVYLRVYGGFVRGIFLLVALVLGLGGLRKESTNHTLAFTLALPVSRHHLVAARALAGLLEVTLLASLPAMLMPALSPLIGQTYPGSQSLQFFVLWVAIGWAVFATAFLASCVFASEYSALTASILAFYLYPLIVARTPALRPYPLHIHYIMNGTGMRYFDPQTSLLIGPLPWTILAGVAAVTLVLLGVAARLTDQSDFP